MRRYRADAAAKANADQIDALTFVAAVVAVRKDGQGGIERGRCVWALAVAGSY